MKNLKNRILSYNLCFAVVLIIALSAFPWSAWPCSPAFSLERYSPKSGTVVPTNAILYLSGPTFYDLVVTSSSSPTMQMTLNVTWIEDKSLWQLDDLAQIPITGLTANQSVTIIMTRSGFSNITETLTLTASTNEDRTPPVITDTPTVTYSFRTAEPQSSCHPWNHFRLVLESSGATDDYGVAAYASYEETPSGRKLVGSDIHDPTVTTQFRPIYLSPDEGQRCFSLVAFDFAGNASDAKTTCVHMQRTSGTSENQPDAGVSTTIDATTDTGGCSCTAHGILGTRPSMFVGVLLLAGMLIKRRRN